LKDYILISPSDEIILDDVDYPSSAVFTLKELKDITVAIVAIDRNKFIEFWEKMM